jgi:hypothetical protein
MDPLRRRSRYSKPWLLRSGVKLRGSALPAAGSATSEGSQGSKSLSQLRKLSNQVPRWWRGLILACTWKR